MKGEKMGLIYGYHNIVTNKWYVGQTTMPLRERHRLHLSGSINSLASDYNSLFHKKIREYGIDNFELYILEDNIPKAKLDDREQYWIVEKHSFVRDNGYNLTCGGQQRKKNENFWDSRCKLSKNDIFDIIELIRQGISLKQIADQYNVCAALISKINRGTSYHIDGIKYPIQDRKRKVLSDELVSDIICRLKTVDETDTDTANFFNIDSDIVNKINLGKTHIREGEKYPIRESLYIRRGRKIKKLLLTTSMTNKQIADLVKCDPSIVSNIRYGKVLFDPNLNYPL